MVVADRKQNLRSDGGTCVPAYVYVFTQSEDLG